MRVVYLFTFLFFSFPSFSQNGFIQAYDFEEGGLAFKNALLVGDTIMIFGNARNLSLPQWGVYFAKIDTMGNVLDYRVHYDSIGHSFLFEQGYGMLKTDDGGYAIVGLLFSVLDDTICSLWLCGFICLV